MIPELIGRFPILSALEPLSEEAYVKILTEPKNALVKQYVELCRIGGVELSFAPEALKIIAKRAAAKGTGARALRAVMEDLMIDLMFELPSYRPSEPLRITAEMAEKGSSGCLEALFKDGKKEPSEPMADSPADTPPTPRPRRESA
jgi:ATP-dependent Clp protease ATP-binding subunit ClpX